MPAHARKLESLPEHEHASDHVALKAYRSRPRRRLRNATELEPIAEVACQRVREFCWDLGEDLEWDLWMAEVARRIGVNYTTARRIMNGEQTSLSSKTIDNICATTGVPPEVFYARNR
jgi:transcriptional regulator with XRE-family HTH domain